MHNGNVSAQRHKYPKEYLDPTRQIRIASGIAILVAIIFVIKLWYLQIVFGNEYRAKSENNRIRTESISPPRGIIYDRNGNILVENRAAFNLAVVPEDVEDMNSTLVMLSNLSGIPYEELEKNLKERKKAPFVPVVLAEDIDWKTLAKIKSEMYSLPGVIVQVEPKRHYRFPGLASHLIGYIGEVSERELRNAKYKGRYEIGDCIGKVGVEKVYEDFLVGEPGSREVEVNARGRKLRVLGERLPQPGKSVFLTIDANLQETAEKCLKGKVGAIVAIDPRNGDILALASSPSYDENIFVKKLSPEQWNEIQTDPEKPLQNRATASMYPPGSTYKVIVAAAGLQEHVITPETTVFCPGYMTLGRRTYRCWKRGGHGSVQLYRALVESCDVYFYQLGLKLGVDRIAKYAKEFGLGQKTGIDLDRELPGLIPTATWKRKRFGVPWQKGETLSIAIGQGFDLVTPLQMTLAYAAIANGGTLWKPHLVSKIEDSERNEVIEFGPQKRRKLSISKRNLELIKCALIGVVNAPHGTGRIARLEDIEVAGKTGTAQVISAARAAKRGGNKQMFKDHAWFICFAPADNPKIVVGVLVEHGGHGSSGAAPLAKAVLEKFFYGDARDFKVAKRNSPR